MTQKTSQVNVSFGRHMVFKPGSRIFSEGDTGNEMYVILSGKVRILISSGEHLLTLAKLKKGDFFGEMALLEQLPRSASAEAVNDVELIALGADDFKFLVQQHPEIAMKVLGKFSARLRDADHLIQLLLLGDSTGTIIHQLVKTALLHYGTKNLPQEWVLAISVRDLTDMTGVSNEHVLAVLSELDRMGLASYDGHQIKVHKHRKLKYYLEYLDWKTKE